MTWVKGQVTNPKGRPKGSVNPATDRFRRALNHLLQDCSGNMIHWLERVAEDDPKGALDTVTKLAEYVYPKLQRTEHTGKDGEQLKIATILESINTPVIPVSEDTKALQLPDNNYGNLIDHGIIDVEAVPETPQNSDDGS